MEQILENQEMLLKGIIKSKQDIEGRIERLKQVPVVAEYIALLSKLDKTNYLYSKEYKEHIISICRSCDHLVVVSGIEYDSWEGRKIFSFGCLKCGADTNLYDYPPKELRSVEDEAYIYYMDHYHMFTYYNTDLFYDNRNQFLEARRLYLQYKEQYKDLSDEMIIELLKTPKEKNNPHLLNRKKELDNI